MSNGKQIAERSKRRFQSFFDRASFFSPILIRLLARKKNAGPLNNYEIAKISGLEEWEIAALSSKLDWRGVDIPTAKLFMKACGIDLENPADVKRVVVYLSGSTVNGIKVAPTFRYLRSSPDWQSFFCPLLLKYMKGQNGKAH